MFHGECTTETEISRYLRRIACETRERKKELARIETMDCGLWIVDCGRPISEYQNIRISELLCDVDDEASCFENCADLAMKLDEKQNTSVSLPSEDSTGCLIIYLFIFFIFIVQ